MSAALLELRGLRVSFGGHPVVHGLDLSLAPGEKLALVGESGSGKSVTALSLLGLAQGARVEGQALWRTHDQPERDLLRLSPPALRAVRGAEIAMIFQEPMTALNPLYTVGDQIAEVFQEKQGLSLANGLKLAIEMLAKVGIDEPARRAKAYPHQLSGGQRQRAMIAMALACKPKLLLADEPTTALDASLRIQILQLLDDLRAELNMAVLLITHDLHLVRRFAHRLAVMERGHLVEQGPVADVFANPQHAYTQRLLASQPQRDAALDALPAAPAEPLMHGRAVAVHYAVPRPGMAGWFKSGRFTAVNGVDCTLSAGRTLAVVGESGSGKSTLALAALGLLPFDGDLALAGGHWKAPRAEQLALRRRVQVVFQDPFSSLSPRLTVAELVGEGLAVHQPQMALPKRTQRVRDALAEVGLTESEFPRLLDRYPHEFSGGQRQRLAIARALIVQPQMLVLDEPTSALDVTIQQQVLQLLVRLQLQRGLAYLLITHDVAVVAAMAHHVIVMRHGQVVETGPVNQVLNAPANDYTRELLAASGLAAA